MVLRRGRRVQEARVNQYTPSAKDWIDSEADKARCGSLLGSTVDTVAGKDGSERRGNRRVFLVCNTETICLQVFTLPSSTLHFLHDYNRQAEMSQQQPDSHSGFIAASRHLVL